MLLMMGGVSPETCWALYKYEINFDKLLHLVGFSIWIILWCTDPRTSNGLHHPNVKLRMRVQRHCNIFIETCVNSKDNYSLFGSISLQNRTLKSYNLVAFFLCGMEKLSLSSLFLCYENNIADLQIDCSYSLSLSLSFCLCRCSSCSKYNYI